MKTFKLPVTWEMYGEMVVEAESLEEAIELAEQDTMDIPIPEGDYVDASLTVNREILEVFDNLGEQ